MPLLVEDTNGAHSATTEHQVLVSPETNSYPANYSFSSAEVAIQWRIRAPHTTATQSCCIELSYCFDSLRAAYQLSFVLARNAARVTRTHPQLDNC